MRSGSLRTVLAAAIVGPVAALAPQSAQAQVSPTCEPEVAPAAEDVIIDRTNALRRSQGIPELDRHWPIKTAARKWSLRMARTGVFEHSNLGWSRGRRAGENIAMAPTGAGAFRAMLNSPPHRRNLLNRTWRLKGIGVVARCDGMLLVTVNLMAP